MSGGPGSDPLRSRGRSSAPLSRDPAVALLIACAAWPPTPAGDARILAAADGIDWTAFVAVVDRHRMAGMAWAAIGRVAVAAPADIRAALAERARRDTIQTLEVALLAERLCAKLAVAGIACGVIKGPPLAQLAYGSLTVRQTRDLDLWVDPARFYDALAVLCAGGFATNDPRGLMRDSRMAWFQKDVELIDPQGRVVELHARLFENIALLPAAPVFEPAVCGTGRVPALAGDALMLYLCVHGQNHAWERLKWLADVGALFARQSPGERERLLLRADATGLRVPVMLALHLCAVAWPERFADPPSVGRRVAVLARLSREAMRQPLEADTRRGVWHVAVASVLMTARARYWLLLLLRWSLDGDTARRLGGGYRAQAISIVLRLPVLAHRRLPVWLRRRGSTSA